MSAGPCRSRRALDRCTRHAVGAIGIVLLLAASAWAKNPVDGQIPDQPPAYAQPPRQPLPGQPAIYAQLKSRWGRQRTAPPPDQPDQPPADAQPGPPPAASQAPAAVQPPADGRLLYRGFTVDATAILSSPRYAAIMAAIPHQIDIVMDCGLKPEVIRFFQKQPIVLRAGLGGQNGRFDARVPGIAIADAVAEPQKPIILHELLHAYHWYVIPGGFRNPDILTFYNRARNNGLYPPNEYVLSNVQEFFAVTASLYLWGNVDRAPHTRENLRAKQPVYYAWLGQFFAVQK